MIPKNEWNDRILVRMHKNFYANLGNIFRDVDELLYQQCKIAYDSIENQDKENFNRSADIIKSIVRSRDFIGKVGRSVAVRFGLLKKEYEKDLSKYKKEKKKKRWENLRKMLGLQK